MKERPILFSGPMVRALLDGSKTQTRRMVNPQTAILTDELARGLGVQPPTKQNQPVIPCKYGAVGDRLWVKETFSPYCSGLGRIGCTYYRADIVDGEEPYGMPWKPSIFMPRIESRITLEITEVRVERLQAIRAQDAIAEGIERFKKNLSPMSTVTTFRDYLTGSTDRAAIQSYQSLWESINGIGSWDANPWVWVIEFRRVEQ